MSIHEEVDTEWSAGEANEEIVQSILMDGFEYSFNRMLDESIQRWKCTNKSCYAYFKIMDNRLLPGCMAHSHPPVDENRQVVFKLRGDASVQRDDRGGDSASAGEPSCNQGASSSAAKRSKLSSDKTPQLGASSPSSGFVSDPDSGSVLQLGSPARSPPKAPRPAEIPPPPTPPLSPNFPEDSDPSNPPPIIDLVEPERSQVQHNSCWYRMPSFSPDFAAHFLGPSTSQVPPPAKPPLRRVKQSNFDKFKDFENRIMQLDNEAFGCAVYSLLSELPSNKAEEIRYEIATLLYGAVEGHVSSRQKK